MSATHGAFGTSSFGHGFFGGDRSPARPVHAAVRVSAGLTATPDRSPRGLTAQRRTETS